MASKTAYINSKDYCNEPLNLPCPLLHLDQILDLQYHARPKWSVEQVPELEELFQLAEEGCECGVARHDVMVVFTEPKDPCNKLAPRKDSLYNVYPWQYLMRGRGGHVIHEFFAKHGQDSSCMERPVAKVAFTELAKVLKNGDLCGKLVKQFHEEISRSREKKLGIGSVFGNLSWFSGIPPTVATKEIPVGNKDDVSSWDPDADVPNVDYGLEDDVSTVPYEPEADANPDDDEEDQPILKDLKDPSQIIALEYWIDQTKVFSYGELNKKIKQNKINPGAVWVVYRPVGEDGSLQDKDCVPWVGIHKDKMGDVLLSYCEQTYSTTTDKLVKKACTQIKKCMKDEAACAHLLERSNNEEYWKP